MAGSFYPGQPEALADAIAEAFDASIAPRPGARAPKALIVPHAGYPYSGPIAASAYRLLESQRDDISRVVLIGPSHRVPFGGVAVSGARRWETPLGVVALDEEQRRLVVDLPGVVVDDVPHAAEHSLEVQVPFLQTVLGVFSLLPLVVGSASPDMVATVLEAVWGGPETLVVVSTDLSHYESYGSARTHDTRTVEAILRADDTKIGPYDACGHGGLTGLLRVVARNGLSIEPLDVRNSGDTAGDRLRVVGYGAFAVR